MLTPAGCRRVESPGAVRELASPQRSFQSSKMRLHNHVPEGTTNLLVGGEAGQGLATVGLVLAKSLVRSGYQIVVVQSYESRIRGGQNTFAIRIGTDHLAAPQEQVDLLVALNAETVELHKEELSPHGVVVADVAFATAERPCLAVPLRDLAGKLFVNTVALGVVASALGLDKALVAKTLEDTFGAKHPEALEENRQALERAFAWVSQQPAIMARLPAVADPPQRLMLNGNEALALGALSAGLRFYSFYPMTPSTSIALTLLQHAEALGCIVEQAEDEIAAINMAIGASFAGARSMVGTSGGGFALMIEGVSLAAMTETALVIAVAQRPAPATGLPTRTEQADLELVLHAGHGEFPRAIFAPGTVEDCYRLTQKAFQVAEAAQGPVFVLTDQYLADSYRAVAPAAVAGLPAADLDQQPSEPPLPYRRYALTESGVSPRLVPGRSEHLVVADSDEHTEDGHLTEDLRVRKQMVEKRLRKAEAIRAQVVPPQFDGDAEPELLLVSWGSSQGSVSEAAQGLRHDGRRVATLHFSQVWPLVGEQFLGHLQAAKEVVVVEGNATGQFARLLRRETGFQVTRRVLRYDGLPITPQYVLRELNRQE
jgi:2-oxoglutarate ferredoxin oxidoreductase subunit alpha